MNKVLFRSIFFLVLIAGLLVITLSPMDSDEEPGMLAEKRLKKQVTKKARSAYFQRMLRDPETGTVPENIRQLELKHASTLPRRGVGPRKNGSMPQFSWDEAGPNDVGGRTRALAVDIANSNTIIAGGVSGGIWKSTDAGASWTLKTDPALGAGITWITQDPRPGNTNRWFATTGEFSGSNQDRGAVAFYYGQGVYQSTDNGETWVAVAPPGSDPYTWDSPFDYATKVQVSPTTGTVFVATNGFGLNRATGDVANMSRVLGTQIFPSWTDFDIASDGTLLAVISEGFNSSTTEPPGVYISTNDGVSWQNVTPTDFPDAPDRSIIAFAPSNPDLAYLLTFTGNVTSANNAFDEKEEMQLHKFDVSAGTSTNLSANLPDFGGQVGDLYSQRGFNLTMAVKPNDENHVFIGGTNLYVSRDGFATQPNNSTTAWVGGYSTMNNISGYTNHHPDQHVLFFDPQNPNALWSGHDGGLSYISDVTTNNAYAWQSKNNGYNVTQFYHVALPEDAGDDRLLGGTQDNGSPFFSFDPVSNTSSASDDISSGDGGFAYLGDAYAIASTQSGELEAYTYTLTGDLQYVANITPAGASGQLFINPYAVDPIDETIIYYPSGNSLWRRGSGAPANTQWSQVTSLQLTGGYTYSAVAAVANGSTSTLYMGAVASGQTPRVYRLDNAATSTAAPLAINIPGAPADGYIHSIAVNPQDANELLVGMSNYNIVGLYYSNDAGASWTAVEGNLTGNSSSPGPSIRSVAIIPLNSDTGYLVGTSTGLYSTIALNGNATTWEQEAATELGSVIVESIATRVSDGRVALATHGRGIFIGMPLNPVANEDEPSAQPTLFELDQNFPNPFNPTTNITFSLNEPSRVTLSVFDVAGREVETMLSGASLQSGAHEIAFDAGALPSGTYLYQLEAVSLSSGQRIHRESKSMTLAK